MIDCNIWLQNDSIIDPIVFYWQGHYRYANEETQYMCSLSCLKLLNAIFNTKYYLKKLLPVLFLNYCSFTCNYFSFLLSIHSPSPLNCFNADFRWIWLEYPGILIPQAFCEHATCRYVSIQTKTFPNYLCCLHEHPFCWSSTMIQNKANTFPNHY